MNWALASAANDNEKLYSIVRYYRDNHPAEVVAMGLTLEEAKRHCCDPDTASATCTDAEGIKRMRERGPWFEGFVEGGDEP